MKKVAVILGLLIILMIGGWLWLGSKREALPLPVTQREDFKFDLSRNLALAGIELSSGPAWSEETMSFEGLTKEGIKIIFSNDLEIEKQISSLQLILKKSTMITNEEGGIKVIDLRTLDPYVSLEDN